MAPRRQVAVVDIVDALQQTGRTLITEKQTLQCLDQVFNQAKVADKLLDSELTQA